MATTPDGKVWHPRPNTSVHMMHPTSADVFVYGSKIATLYSDGTVMVHASDEMSNVVRNRLNDVLAPLGWNLRKKNARWVLEGCQKAVCREYLHGQVIRPFNQHATN